MTTAIEGIGRDRLAELRSKYDISLTDDVADHASIPDESKFVSTFYSKVANIKAKLSDIDSEINELNQNYKVLLGTSTGTSEHKKLKEKIGPLRKSANTKLFEVKDGVAELQRENKKVAFLSAEYRMRENQQMALNQEFTRLLEKFNRVNATFREMEEGNLKRQIKVVDPDLPDEKVEQMLEDKEFDISKYMDKILLGSSAKSTVTAMYMSAKETRDDLLELETSMEELVVLFRDLNTLVRDQSSMINNIEFNVQRTSEAMAEGVKNVRTARKRAKKCIIM
uniref:t-SNARE coiled-coil homology domain-containing protein n=1 Tax=Percolomonas cosmopolitus TaxID=63605 RepID=A0A7S1KQT0_9EUKA|mmetsp:Transcript_5601/g.21073  ORF Transcript_5601/g.21073 Transcript_5601/m.21073 type:complete len:281 (+) Transcript_5601:158-1000(+)|eukprot:CAMPEP_0117444672 /NCGR_PEP_ID=MMETSP0759-20121206/5366_1 /TAXON_ID=63605 /ORGANISM="Percolomonas cosmopolitus, Strain WS" /LENGTH=280 /DNA_ID=CAMNT_0005236755 /DNA_START=108 /DNA_END=950 /DNA_ORIENTATION=+